MAISTDFNYDDLLSLDKAKLVNRTRLNFLGSQELILDYNGVTSVAREECTQYLEANRLSLIDPHFGFKTYEGTWFCIDINYDENKKFIRQRFKIDSALTNEATKRTSAGTLAEKSYYWKIVDPDSIELPAAGLIPDGTTYTKTSNDNGDGTYDVVISKDLSINFEGNEITDGHDPQLSAFVTDSDYVDGTYGSPNGEYEFIGYTRYFCRHTSTPGNPIDELNFRDTEVIVNGYTVWRDGADLYGVWFDSGLAKMVITPVANIGGALPTNYWVKGSGFTDVLGNYTGTGGTFYNHAMEPSLGFPWWERADGYFSIVAPDNTTNAGSILVPTDQYELRPRGSVTPIYTNTSGANPTGWSYGIDPAQIELGRNPISQTQTSESFAGSEELEFDTEVGGTIPAPIVGEIKTISNVPNGDGTFKSTVVTITANPQRNPPNVGVFQFASREVVAIIPLLNSTISAKNKSVADLARDSEFLTGLDAAWSNSISSSINKFGLIDYNITSFWTG